MNKEKALKNQGLEFREDIRLRGRTDYAFRMLKETWNASANTAVPPDGFGCKVTMLWQRTLFQSPCGVRGEPECHHKNPRCLRRGVVSHILSNQKKKGE